MYVRPHRRAAKPDTVRKLYRKALRRSGTRKRSERRIVVELVSAADVARLEARDEAVKAEQAAITDELTRRVEGLHHQLYEVIDALGRLRNKK